MPRLDVIAAHPHRRPCAETQNEQQAPEVALAVHKLLCREDSVSKAVFDAYVHPTAQSSLLNDHKGRYWEEEEEDSEKVQRVRTRHVRSVCGLPVLPEAIRFLRWWIALIYLIDLTYTAFLLPVMITIDPFGSGGVYLDTTVGAGLSVGV